MIVIAIVLLSLLLITSLVGNVLLAIRALALQDQLDTVAAQVEESLDVMNGSYGAIASIAATPVASDDPLVRQLVSETKRALDSILVIANKLTVSFDEVEETDAR